MQRLTYCTNVHPLGNLQDWKDTISFFGAKIGSSLQMRPFPMGLWFHRDLLVELESDTARGDLSRWMRDRELESFTFNAFPYGNFHQPVVKTKVYLPNWTAADRCFYTQECARVLAALLCEDHGTISTLPLGWKAHWDENSWGDALKQLFDALGFLRRCAEKTGKTIQLCLEPEPGCILETTDEVIAFWRERLRPAAKKMGWRDGELDAFCGVCFDTCHHAVQFEDCRQSLLQLKENSVPIGKIQLSNGLCYPGSQEPEALNGLKAFCEEKFLHQTRVKQPDGPIHRFDDLPEALMESSSLHRYPWRTHYHLPVFLENVPGIPGLQTLQGPMLSALQTALEENLTRHYEIETYTWWVLPKAMRPETPDALAESIVREFEFILPHFKAAANNG